MDDMTTGSILKSDAALSPELAAELTAASAVLNTIAIKVCAAWTLSDKTGSVWMLDSHYLAAHSTNGAPPLSARITNQRGVLGFRLSIEAPYERVKVELALPPSTTLRGDGAPYPLAFLLAGQSFIGKLPDAVTISAYRAEKHAQAAAADIWRRLVQPYIPHASILAQSYERETAKVIKTRMVAASLCRKFNLFAKEHPQMNEIHLHEQAQPFPSFIVDQEAHVRTGRLFMLTNQQIAALLGKPFALAGEP
jgi:hypothetical protein